MVLPPPQGIALRQEPPEPEVLEAAPEPASVEAVEPPFKSPLRLTPEQVKNLEDETTLRIQELRREMGLTPLNEVVPGSWMWLRKCHEAYYQGDLSWRLAMGSIFQKSNFTLGSGLRHVRYVSARVQDDLLGTSPFMAALGRNQDNEDLARQVEEYVQGEIEQAPVRSELREGQKVALYRNECVVKTGWLEDSSPFVGEATVLVDDATEEPITTPDKQLFIFEDDNFHPSTTVEGLMLLETDPSFTYAQHSEPGLVVIPPSKTLNGEDIPERIGRYQFFPELPQRLVKREGVYCDALDYRSFLCPLKVKSIHDADTCVHLFLETPSSVRRRYGAIDVAQHYFSWWDAPGQDKPKFEQGETNNPPTVIYQQMVIAECYRRIDPDGTGEDKECFLVMDLTNGKLIYWNYLANHMKKRPFDPIPGIEKVPGRWYGRGIYGMLEDHLLYEDAELNRANFKNSKDATIQFAYQDASPAWKNGQPPVIGTDDTIWINPNWSPEGGKKPIWRENLYEKVETDLEMMNTMRQSADSLVGAISTQTANQSNFDQSKTATGNQLVQQASDVITKATEQDQTDALNKILEQVVDVALEHMEKTKLTFKKDTGELVTLNRNECRSLSRDVRLLLTRSKSTQLLTTSKEALIIAKDYRAMMQTDPEGAKQLRELYVSQLKGLEIADADQLCPEITDEMLQAFAQRQNPGEPPKKSISTKFVDLARSEQEQVLSSEGIHPAPPEEIAAAEAKAAAEEAIAKAQQPTPEMKAA